MQLTTNKEKLFRALVQSSRFTSSRIGATAGLQGLLLINTRGELHIYSTNLNTFFHTSIETSLQEDVRLLLDHHKVVEFVTLLNNGEVVLLAEKDKLVISQGKTKGAFPLLPNADFPTPPKVEGEGQIINGEKFEKIISLVLFSASRDTSRPVLSGINFVEKEGFMDIVATDGFRLSLFHMKKPYFPNSWLLWSSG